MLPHTHSQQAMLGYSLCHKTVMQQESSVLVATQAGRAKE